MTKLGKFFIFSGSILFIVAIVLIFVVDWTDLRIKKEIRETVQQQETIKENATSVLKEVVEIANELSGITSGAVFNYEIVDTDGRSANFGIVQYADEVKGEIIVEEHMVNFREVGSPTSNTAEVDRATNKVIAMHRTPADFFGYAPGKDMIEATVLQFVKRAYPEFTRIESTLEYIPGTKTNPQGINYFFRWNDKQFAVPDGLDMDIPPFIQVGITDDGFIFSYDNTVALYHNLPKEALRAICAFVEIPQSDDSSLDPEKGEVIIWFSEYEPFQNRYLVLPFEPETDFAGCSESAKTYLRYLPDEPIKN
ncbi:MAG: hypothetical protein NUV64_00060 [Parcubacteria group bacterium]|nr:hypothetical protein [Parcubacteria group bacterium]MCR4342893.1 hypothetical protein [Patescibacteria group bacterium]